MLKKFPILLLVLFPLLAAVFSLVLKTNYLLTTILMFAPPSIWLLSQQKKQVKKILLFTTLISLPFTLMLDYIITKDLGWYIVNSLFPFRLFHIVPLEQFIWGYLYILLLISFYEYFLDKKDRKQPLPIMPNLRIFTIFTSLVLALFMVLATLNPSLLNLNYAYFILGVLLGVIPLIVFLFNFPTFVPRFIRSIGYFGYLGVLNEYVSLKLNHWIFPGQHFIGLANFFGYAIPYEEVAVYFFLLSPILLSYYEFLDDDRK